MPKTKKVRIRKRGRSYSYIFEAGHTNGKRKVVEKGGFPDADSAYTAGTEAFTNWKHGNIGITSASISLAQFMQTWLDNACASNLKESTWNLYATNIKNHIKAKPIGASILQGITPSMVDTWVRNMAKDGLAFKTIQLIHAILKKALDYAVYPCQLIQSNPALYVKIPKNAPRHVIERKIIPQETISSLLLKYPFNHAAHIPILLLYHTGMRISEVLGLCWKDIDFDTQKLSVRRQFRYNPLQKHYIFTGLKNESGKRDIVMDAELVEMLQRWKAQQQENEEKFGESYCYLYRHTDERQKNIIVSKSKALEAEDNLVHEEMICTKPNGCYIPGVTFQHYLANCALNAHSFRHTHATLLIEHGASPKGVAGRLGHANTQITQNLYTHNTQKMQEDTAEIFENLLQANRISRQNADK